MVKTLILVRHGQAEPSSAAVPDIERSLTDAGRAALAGPQGFPRTFALLSSMNAAKLRFGQARRYAPSRRPKRLRQYWENAPSPHIATFSTRMSSDSSSMCVKPMPIA